MSHFSNFHIIAFQFFHMKKTSLLCFTVFLVYTVHAQTIIQKDPAIEKMVSEVNADSLKSYINTLVGFW